jgi:hypothetical protein
MHTKNKILTLFLIILLSPALVYAAELKLDTDLTFQYDNNVSLAESNRDIFSDEIVSLDLIASKSFMLNPHSNLTIKGKLARHQFLRFEDLSNTGFALGARYRMQPVIGFYQPWLALGINAEKLVFDDSDIRDGTLFNVNVSVHKRFSEMLKAHIGIGAERRVADTGDTFEWQRHSFFSGAQYQWSDALVLIANYSYLSGDQVFVATASPKFRNSANSIADDPVFGQRRAYRLDAHANTLNTGINYRISPNNSLDAGVNYAKIKAEADHQYDATQVHVSWLHRF